MAKDFPVNIVFDAVDQVSKPVRRINDRIERMTGPVRQFNNRMRALGNEAGLGRVSDAAGRVRRRMGDVARSAARVTKRLGLIGTVGSAALLGVTNNVAAMGDEAAKTARSMGVSAEFVQEYQFAAERLGVRQKTVNQSFQAFSKRLGELRGGYGRLNSLLKENNPRLQEQLKTANSTEEAFSVLMDAMGKMEDPAKRSSLAAAAFSRQGIKMTNVALAGSEEVKRLRQRARELGVVMDGDATKSAERYKDAMSNLRASFKGAQVAIGAELMPVSTDLMTRLSSMLVNNRDTISEWATAFATNIPSHLQAIKDGAISLFESMRPLIDVGQWLFDTFGAGKTILAAAALVIGGPLLTSVAALVPAVVLLGIAIGATPIGWFLAGAAAIGGAIWATTKAVEAVRERWPAVWEDVSDAVGVVMDSVKGLFQFITGNVEGALKTFRRIGETIDKWIPDWIQDLFGGDDNKTVTVRGERADQGGAVNGPGARPEGAQAAASGGAQEAVRRTESTQRTERRNRLEVDFRNVPRGTRVSQEGDDDDDVDVNVGRQMVR
jgi:methyl-accepting chemotaxis protein